MTALVLLVLATACGSDDGIANASNGAPAQVTDVLAESLGGEAELRNLRSYRIVAGGERHLAGEGLESTDGSELISSFDSVVSHDLAGNRFRVDYDRTIHYAADAKLVYSEIADGDVGTIDGVDTLFGRSNVMTSARLASTSKHLRLLNPHVIARDALDDPSLATDAGTADLDGRRHRLIEVEDPVHPLTLWVDTDTGHISRLTTMENHHVFRDVELEVRYADWSTESPVPFPTTVSIHKDGELIHEETRSSMDANVDLDDAQFEFDATAAHPAVPELAAWGERSHQFQQEWSSFGFPLDFLDTTVEARELSPGVWFVGGGTYISMVIEQSDGLVVIEAPQYPERAVAILGWMADEFPGQRVKAVVATHHHVDHSGGVREFAAAGATVVASAESEEFFRRIMEAPSTIAPDTMALQPVEVSFDWVPADGSVTLDDPSNPVIAVHIETHHASDMVMVHVPSAELVFNSDLHDPNSASVVGPEAQPEGLLAPDEVQELLDAIEALDQPVTTVVGGHGGGGPLASVGVGPVQELEEFVAQFG